MPRSNGERDEATLARDALKASEHLRVSYSSLQTDESCHRKFEFQKIYPRRPRMFESFAADVGSALHAGYQSYLIHQDEDRALWDMCRAYPIQAEFMQDKDDRSLEAACATLQEMIDSSTFGMYELAQIIHPETGLPVPAIEVPFEIRFAKDNGLQLNDGRGFAFVGYIDAILRHRTTGAYRTMDIKTHRRYAKDATANYKFHAQQLPYGIAIEHVQGNSVDSFDVLYLDTFVDLLEPRCEEYIYVKNQEDVQEWLMNTVMQLQGLARYSQMDYFPRTGGGCTAWNKACYWLDVCESRDRDAILQFIMMGEEAEVPAYVVPWIEAEISPFG